MVAEERVASTRHITLPSMSPLTELDVRSFLRRDVALRASSSHAGGSLQPPAASSDLLSAAARKQAGACSLDRARTIAHCPCGTGGVAC